MLEGFGWSKISRLCEMFGVCGGVEAVETLKGLQCLYLWTVIATRT